MEDYSSMFYSLIIKGMLTALVIVAIFEFIKRKKK